MRIVDRRLNGKNKSVVNRQKFLRRYKKQIRKAVADAISSKDRSIEDIGKGGKVSIPANDTAEPIFHHGSGGINDRIQSGNKKFIPGDTIKRPKSGQGDSGSNASNSGEGVDDFVFHLNKEEFLNFFFENLELPNLVKTKLSSMDEYSLIHAGHSSSGIPPNINILRSTKGALSRRIALRNPLKKKLKKVQEKLQLAEQNQQHKQCLLLKEEIEHLKKRIIAIPFIDDFDLRYNSFIHQPKPVTQAVMFCIMDISASMDQNRKDLAKRFFMLLYLFLTRTYKRIQVVFISHHTRAKEVNEEEFFYSQETGGTIVSTALELMREIIQKRYPEGDWNIYAAQASDGDNWDTDPIKCKDILMQDIMPKVQYFAYIEITKDSPQKLWYEYQHIEQAYEFFAMKRIQQLSDIYPVFRELFKKAEN
ncbi:MAG: YeaH/YhbH family protein [Pseudomonadota bacterium]